MKIIINGTPQTFEKTPTLADIVSKFCRQPHYVVSALNEKVIAPKDRSEILVQEGDRIELITPVGGG